MRSTKIMPSYPLGALTTRKSNSPTPSTRGTRGRSALLWRHAGHRAVLGSVPPRRRSTSDAKIDRAPGRGVAGRSWAELGEAAEIPISARAEPEHLNRLASLVDFAAAKAWQFNDAARLWLVVDLWSAIQVDWGPRMSECVNFDQLLVRGLREDGPERLHILEGDMFRGSYVRAVIAVADSAT